MTAEERIDLKLIDNLPRSMFVHCPAENSFPSRRFPLWWSTIFRALTGVGVHRAPLFSVRVLQRMPYIPRIPPWVMFKQSAKRSSGKSGRCLDQAISLVLTLR